MPRFDERGTSRQLTRCAALLVLVGAGVVLAAGLRDAAEQVRVASDPVLRVATTQEAERFACLEARMRAELPRGALVVNEGDSASSQRITEELTPGYRFAASPTPGAWAVAWVTPGPCHDVGVRVWQLTAASSATPTPAPAP